MKPTYKAEDQFIKESAKIRQKMRRLEAKEQEWRDEKNKIRDVLRDLESALDSSKDLIMVLDTDFRILKANLATSRYINKSVNEILGKTCNTLIHEIDPPPRECPLNIIKISKKHEEVECYLSAKDMWLQVSSDPVFDKNGKIVRIVHILRDITEFRRTEASLRESEGRFRKIFDFANHGIQLIDLTDRTTFMVNRTLCQMLGYNKEEFKKLRIDDMYPQADIPYINKQFSKLMREEIEFSRNIPLVKKDGSILYADVSASPFMISSKTYLMTIFRDIKEHNP